MAKFIYVDNSNVFIEGQRVAAVENGKALEIEDAVERQIFDYSYRLDFGKLYEFVAQNDDPKVARAMLFGSRPPQNDSLWATAKKVGFEPIIENRNVANKEKKIDTGIGTAMLEHSYEEADKKQDHFVLVAGDSDHVPAVRSLVRRGFIVNVVFWAHASYELQTQCTKFIAMDSNFNNLTR